MGRIKTTPSDFSDIMEIRCPTEARDQRRDMNMCDASNLFLHASGAQCTDASNELTSKRGKSEAALGWVNVDVAISRVAVRQEWINPAASEKVARACSAAQSSC